MRIPTTLDYGFQHVALSRLCYVGVSKSKWRRLWRDRGSSVPHDAAYLVHGLLDLLRDHFIGGQVALRVGATIEKQYKRSGQK